MKRLIAGRVQASCQIASALIKTQFVPVSRRLFTNHINCKQQAKALIESAQPIQTINFV